MIAIAKMQKIQVMLATWTGALSETGFFSTSYWRLGIREHNAIIRDLSSLYQMPMFDFSSVMPDDNALWYDDIHVNSDGAKLKAQLFAEFIHKNKLIENDQ